MKLRVKKRITWVSVGCERFHIEFTEEDKKKNQDGGLHKFKDVFGLQFVKNLTLVELGYAEV